MPNSKQCTLDTCPIEYSIFNYQPSLAANVILLALFALSFVIFAIQGIFSRRNKLLAFTICLLFGAGTEVIGYIGRVIAHGNPFGDTGFLTQIVCLSIAPAFYAAAIYLCLSRIVIAIDPSLSRFKPVRYTQIFVPCDFLSLVLQGAGGGLSSVASQNDQDTKVGTNILIAGLVWQVFTLTLFIILASEYAVRVLRNGRHTRRTSHTNDQLQGHEMISGTGRFHFFIFCLALALLTIYIRCVYRIAELSQGWDGPLIKNQATFIGLEGVMILVASFALNLGHPMIAYLRKGQQVDGEKIRSSRESEA